jgi:uncharacterized protein
VTHQAWRDSLDLEGWSDTDLHLEHEVPTSRLALEGCRPPETLTLALDVHRTGLPGAYEYHLRGVVEGAMTLTCVRCLAEFPWKLHAPFDIRFLPISAKPLHDDEEADEHEMVAGDADMEYYRRPVFDLVSLVREQVYLELPMDPVCREDCAGLCPRCGADRNQGAHECQEKPIDPRWSALRALDPTRGSDPRNPN